MTEPAPPPFVTALQRRLAFHAATLFALGALTGGYVAAAETGQIDVDRHSAMAAHLNALLASMWLLGLAWSLRFSRLGLPGSRAMSALALSSAYANWAITAIKAAFHVRGIEFTTDGPRPTANNVVCALLMIFVVLPTLGAAGLWIYGLRPGPNDGP